MGADNRQLALYNGLETVCSGEFVYFRPDEYITYGAKGLSDIRTKSQGEKEISVFDHLGSVRCSLKQDGTLIGYRDYEPFGAPLSAKQEKTRLGFIDKEQDKESSLADHGVRKYDYETGRFISCDALWGKYLGWSPYQYSGNDPLSRMDYNGKKITHVNEQKEIMNDINKEILKTEIGRQLYWNLMYPQYASSPYCSDPNILAKIGDAPDGKRGFFRPNPTEDQYSQDKSDCPSTDLKYGTIVIDEEDGSLETYIHELTHAWLRVFIPEMNGKDREEKCKENEEIFKKQYEKATGKSSIKAWEEIKIDQGGI